MRQRALQRHMLYRMLHSEVEVGQLDRALRYALDIRY
jgi:hypothetical protein